MLIRFIADTFVADRSYAAGDIVDLNDEVARRVIGAKAATPTKGEAAKPNTPVVPNAPKRKATPALETAVVATPVVETAIAAD